MPDYDILANVTTTSSNNKTAKDDGWWRPQLHPLFTLAILSLLPRDIFINRGMTQWFHFNFILHMVSGAQLDWWRRFLVIQGLGVCAGWYAAVVHEYLAYGRFCHLLYNNMPSAMKAIMLTTGNLASGGIITDSAGAITMLVATHAMDLLAHPILTYTAWKMHQSKGGTLRSLVTWDLIAATYLFSRIYSVAHLYYNNSNISGIFYYGFDVYNIDNLASYTAGYVGEAIFTMGLVAYKLL